MTIVDNGKATAMIVVPAEPDIYEELAAKELVEHIKRMANVDLAVGSQLADGLQGIYLGSASEAGLIERVGGDGAFVLRVKADRIDIAGLGEGPAYGVYELLEQLGVRWFMPGDLGLVCPRLTTVAVPVQETVQVPSFTGRHFQMGHVDWQTRLRCGGPTFPSAHGFPGFSGAAGKKLFEAHPEYYSLVNGQRIQRQACVSAPGALEEVVKNVKAYFAKYPERQVIGMGPNDGGGFCQCDDCRALDGDDFDPFSGEHCVTDRYVWFFNQILKGIEDEYPDKKIGFYIYHTYMRPPVKVKPDPRITGALAPIGLCRIHGVQNPVCPEKQYYEWLASEWGKLIPELWDRGYWSNLACPGFTFPIVHRVRKQIPFGHLAGIFGWRVETFPHWGTELPGMYIAAKLMWKYEANVDALLQDFYTRFYGPAAEPMGRYHELIDSTVRDADFHTGCSWDIPHLYPPEIRQQARAYIDQAAALAPQGSEFAARVQMIAQTADFTAAFCEMMEARTRLDFAGAKQALDRLDAAAGLLLAYQPPMIGERMYTGYMRRFFRHCTEQGYARVTGGNRLAAACNDEWEFLIDSTSVGLDLKYFDPSLKGPNWQTIKTSSLSWSDQGLRYYKGLSWYRQTVDVPAEFAGKRIFLWCGGVDELAKVWINGTPIGISHGAAIYPFELDATDAVKAGANTIVMAVSNERVNELGTGGILAPVILYAPAAGAEAKLENIRDLRPTFP